MPENRAKACQVPVHLLCAYAISLFENGVGDDECEKRPAPALTPTGLLMEGVYTHWEFADPGSASEMAVTPVGFSRSSAHSSSVSLCEVEG